MKPYHDKMTPFTTSLLATTILTSVASAAVTFDNITGASSATTELITGPMTFDMSENAVAFEITTNTQTWTLDSVEINFSPNTFGSSNLQIDLYTMGNPVTGAPLSAIVPLVGNLSPFGLETYSPSSTITLSPNSSFWIHIHEPIGDGEFEVFTEPSSAGNGLWNVTDQRLNLGGNWNNTSVVPEVRFNASSVPEPSSILLAALGALGLLGRHRR